MAVGTPGDSVSEESSDVANVRVTKGESGRGELPSFGGRWGTRNARSDSANSIASLGIDDAILVRSLGWAREKMIAVCPWNWGRRAGKSFERKERTRTRPGAHPTMSPQKSFGQDRQKATDNRRQTGRAEGAGCRHLISQTSGHLRVRLSLGGLSARTMHCTAHAVLQLTQR